MPSSISSSESASREKATPRAIAVLLALAALFLVGVEGCSRYLAVRMSRIEVRASGDYASAVSARPAGERRTILLLGNSLLGAGVEFQVVRAALAPEWDARRLYIENTGYYDFYYGMRRLHSEGARYNVTAVFLSPGQLAMKPAVRGEYFAYRLMSAADVLDVARDTGLDRTTASNLLFGRFSAFYGLRAEIRKVLLGRLMPGLPGFMRMVTSGPRARQTEEEVYRQVLPRARAYRELAERQRSRIVLVLPPQLDSGGVVATKRAASEAGVGLISVAPAMMGPTDFSDGFHLNEAGARKFTAALIPELRRMLARTR